MNRLNKLRLRVREEGLGRLPGRVLRWLRWQIGPARRRARAQRALSANHSPPSVCADIRVWCAGHPDATYRVVVEKHRIVRPPPHTIEPEVHSVFEPYYEVDAPEQALVGVPRASVATNGLIFLPDGSLAGEAVTHLREFRSSILADEPAYVRPLPTTVRELTGNYYSLMFRNFDNYYHWHHDVVMRLPAVQPHLPSDTRFIVPQALEGLGYAMDMLSVVGLRSAQLCVYPNTEVWTCERLHFCVPYLKRILDTPRHMQPFAELCRTRYGVTERTPTKRVYISRRLANHWRTSNEAEVTGLLESYGFETYELSGMTFEQQVTLFAQAEIIVGSGAGLSNMIFAPTGAMILNVQEPTLPRVATYTGACALGHAYWYFFGDAVPNPGSRYGVADIHVPLDKLRDSLDQMLG